MPIDLTKPSAHILHEACTLAVEMGLVLLARVSELIPTDSNHYIESQHVLFHLGGGRTCHAHEAHAFNAAAVTAVTMTICDAKNDQEGVGFKCHYPRVTVGPNVAFDVVGDMFSWASSKRPREGEPFLSSTGSWVLPYAAYNNSIKATALACGLPPFALLYPLRADRRYLYPCSCGFP